MSTFCKIKWHIFPQRGPRGSLWTVLGRIRKAFLKHSFLLPFLSQELSLNVDINRILPVKVAGVCPKSLSRSLILPQSCNVVNPGKIFHWNSVDSPLIAS